MSRVARTLALVCPVMLLCCMAFGQQANISSLVPSANFGPDSINLQTAVPIVNVPVRSKGGPVPFNAIDMRINQCSLITTNTAWTCLNQYANGEFTSVIGGLGLGLSSGYSTTGTCGGHSNVQNFQSWYVTDTSGSGWHPVSLGTIWMQYCPQSLSGWTTDGSGLYVTLTSSWNSNTQSETLSGTLTDKFGNTAALGGSCGVTGCGFAGNAKWSDPFGNNIQQVSGGYSDSINPSGTVLNLVSGGYTYDDTTGTSQPINITAVSKTLKSTFGCSKTEESGTAYFTTKYAFPDGTSESFGYESIQSGTVTGRISSITLRTGGTVSYTYGSMDCTQYRPLTLSRVGADGTTSFTVNVSGSNGASTTTVLDPGKNKTVYSFTGYFPVSGSPASNVPALTEVQVYQNTGTVGSPSYTLLTTDVYCYNTTTSGCATAAVNYPITAVTVTHTINGMTNSSKTVTDYDSYGNVTEVDLYDFGASSPTQKTITAYGNWTSGNSCSAIGSNIFGKPCYIETDMGSNAVSRTEFQYNTTTVPGFLYQKNMSTGATTGLSTYYTPNTNGTIASSGSTNNLTTTYSYTGTGGCNSLLPTSSSTTVNGVTLTSSTTWDCNNAVELTTTDVNQNGDATTYNAVIQPATYTDRSGFETTFNYTNTSVSSSSSFGSSVVNNTVYTDTFGRPNVAQVQQGPSAANYDTVSNQYSLSGPNAQIKASTPCVQTSDQGCSSFVTTLFDPLGRTISTTDAFTGKLSYSYTQTGSKYDVSVTLGPAPTGENAKTVQTESDGLGRVLSVCSLETSGGSACGQAMGNSGILTSASYSYSAESATVTQTRGSQTHTTVTDGLGRITSVTTPEAGNVTYLYDSDQTNDSCSNRSYWGALVKVTRASGTYVCYDTDAALRVTDVGNSIGGTSSPCKRFRFDATSNKYNSVPSGYPSSGANIMGRLMEAETDDCSTTSLTDEWFAYDKNGRMTDMWEKTPNSGGYYHTTVTYNSNGTVASLSGIPGYSSSALTWGVDGEGRPNSMSVGSTTIVSATAGSGFQYDAGDTVLNVPIGGSGDQDTYTYNNNGNMTKYTFKVNGTTDVGTLTWNANGTLGSLGIADGFNSGGSMTCNYLYDDVERLGVPPNSPTPPASSPYSVDCGSSIFRQAYGYDQYNNLTTVGNPGTNWQPGYSSTNNRMTGSTYDGDGNVTYDGVNTYTWDAYGMLSGAVAGSSTPNCTSNGNCDTRDAFGNVVDLVINGSAYAQILYTPIGRTANMNGQTTTVITAPEPGGGTALIYSTSSITFMHPDWLGTDRLGTDVTGRSQVFDTAYNSFGQLFDHFGATTQIFTGDQQDAFGGLFDTPNRQLMPTAGRWLSPDPAHAGWNGYAYVTNPNSDSDPSGLGGGGDCNVNSAGGVPDGSNDGNCNPNNYLIFNASADGGVVTVDPIPGLGVMTGQGFEFSSSNPDSSGASSSWEGSSVFNPGIDWTTLLKNIGEIFSNGPLDFNNGGGNCQCVGAPITLNPPGKVGRIMEAGDAIGGLIVGGMSLAGAGDLVEGGTPGLQFLTRGSRYKQYNFGIYPNTEALSSNTMLPGANSEIAWTKKGIENPAFKDKMGVSVYIPILNDEGQIIGEQRWSNHVSTELLPGRQTSHQLLGASRGDLKALGGQFAQEKSQLFWYFEELIPMWRIF